MAVSFRSATAGGRCLCQLAPAGTKHLDTALCPGTDGRRDLRGGGNVPQRRPAAQDKDPIGAAETAKGVDAERRLDADE